MGDVIYTPKGRAREYAPWGVNVYLGCGNQCKYCYVPNITGRPQDATPRARANIAGKVHAEVEKVAGTNRPVLLSFLSDPYPECEPESRVTHAVVVALGQADARIRILTKNGARALMDTETLVTYDVEFGQTLNMTDPVHQQEWEPGSDDLITRAMNFVKAKKAGLRTWCSMEPVIYPKEALDVIATLSDAVDMFALGKLNHYPDIEKDINWASYGAEALRTLDLTDCSWYVKNDLWNLLSASTRATFPKRRHTARWEPQ